MHSYAVSEVIDEDERERLILEHLPQVRLIARRIQERSAGEHQPGRPGVHRGHRPDLGHRQLRSGHNVKLKTYAEYKIRGAILDSLRGLDWAPRQKRRKAKQIEAAIAAAEQRLQASPTEDEIAAQLGITLEEYHEWLVEIRGLNIASLEYAGGDQGKTCCTTSPMTDENLPSTLLESPSWNDCWRRASTGSRRSSAPF